MALCDVFKKKSYSPFLLKYLRSLPLWTRYIHDMHTPPNNPVQCQAFVMNPEAF